MPSKATAMAFSASSAEHVEPEVDPSFVTLRVKRDRRQSHVMLPAASERRREWRGAHGTDPGSN